MSHKLTENQWIEIRILMKSPNKNVTGIAKHYKISRNSIYAKMRNEKKKNQVVQKKIKIISKIIEFFTFKRFFNGLEI